MKECSKYLSRNLDKNMFSRWKNKKLKLLFFEVFLIQISVFSKQIEIFQFEYIFFKIEIFSLKKNQNCSKFFIFSYCVFKNVNIFVSFRYFRFSTKNGWNMWKSRRIVRTLENHKQYLRKYECLKMMNISCWFFKQLLGRTTTTFLSSMYHTYNVLCFYQHYVYHTYALN